MANVSADKGKSRFNCSRYYFVYFLAIWSILYGLLCFYCRKRKDCETFIFLFLHVMSYLQKCDEIYISYFFDHVLVYTLDQPYLLSVQQLQTTDMTDCCVEILTLKW